MLDVLGNGSGFLRLDPAGQSRDDVYVSPAQIRRCELRAGDEVSGPVRPPRRNERHPSLVRVETVNGAEAEPPEQRPWFGDLTPVFPSERLAAPAAFDAAPFGKGSRVAVAGPPGAGATTLLMEVVRTVAERHPELSLQVVLAGVRPEEVGAWRAGGQPVAGGSFERSPEAQAQAAELAVERAKRQVERGGHATVVIDALDALPAERPPPPVRRRPRNRGGRHPDDRGRHRRRQRRSALGHHATRARPRRAGGRRTVGHAERGPALLAGAGAVSDLAPARLRRELDQLEVAVRLGVAERARRVVEHDLELALHHALVEPGAAEHEPADPVHQRALGGAVQVAPAAR